MNKIVIAGIGLGATVVGYAVGSIFGKKVNTKVSSTVKQGATKMKETGEAMSAKVKNIFKRDKGEQETTETPQEA